MISTRLLSLHINTVLLLQLFDYETYGNFNHKAEPPLLALAYNISYLLATM